MKSTLVSLVAMFALITATHASIVSAIVPVEVGAKAFRDGDVIEITQVVSTSQKLEQGDVVTVRGRYRLDSTDSARLMLLLTQTESNGKEETDESQIVRAQQGWHEFEASITVKHGGFLHLTFYDMKDGKPFGGVYFGTADQMANAKDISIEHYQTKKTR